MASPFQVNVRSNVAAVVARFRDNPRQMRYATAVALTHTAQDVKVAQVAEMERVFDRPTRFTLNSVFMRPATKANLVAIVWLKDFAGKGTPAEKYLAAQIEGGPRKLKGFERLLLRSGLLPTGYSAVPGSAAKLDSYGNMSAGQIVQILSALKAFGEQGFAANRTDASKKRRGKKLPMFFVGRPGGGRLPRGVWQRFTFAHGSAIKPVLIFVRGPRYRPIYRFHEVSARTVTAVFPGHMERAAVEAMATAR